APHPSLAPSRDVVHGQPCECRLDSVVEWPLIPFYRTPEAQRPVLSSCARAAERRVLISCAGSRWPPNKIGIPTLTTQASLSRLPGWSPDKQLNEHTRNGRNFITKYTGPFFSQSTATQDDPCAAPLRRVA